MLRVCVCAEMGQVNKRSDVIEISAKTDPNLVAVSILFLQISSQYYLSMYKHPYLIMHVPAANQGRESIILN